MGGKSATTPKSAQSANDRQSIMPSAPASDRKEEGTGEHKETRNDGSQPDVEPPLSSTRPSKRPTETGKSQKIPLPKTSKEQTLMNEMRSLILLDLENIRENVKVRKYF